MQATRLPETSLPGRPSVMIPARILIVENDPLLAQDIALHIETLGHEVAGTLTRGEDILSQGMALSPDLILMDIALDGAIDSIEKARQIQGSLDVPVVFLTALSDEVLVKRAFTTAPFAYLQKPLKEHELLLTLELALSHHRSEAKMRHTQNQLEKLVAQRTAELVAANQALQQQIAEQQATHATLQRFRATLDHLADAIFLIDRATMRFFDFNQTACEHLGYSREELLALGPQDIKPFFNRSMLEQRFDEIARSPERSGRIDTFYKPSQGKMFPVEIRLRALESEGRPIMVAIARDITLKRKIELSLRESEEQFRQIAESMQQVLWIRDIKTQNLLYISPSFEKIWERPCAAVYERPRLLLADLHPDDREFVTRAMQQLWAEPCRMELDYRLLHADGRVRWLRTQTFPISDEQGQAYRIGAITEDVTAHKEHEEALRLSEEKFRRLFKSSPIGIALVSPEHRLMESNPALCAMLGYSKEELRDKTLADITLPADLQSGTELLQQLLSGELSSYTLEKRYLRKNGESFWGKLHAAVIRDQLGQPMYGLGMVEDIDQVKHVESLRLAHEAEQRNALVREVHHRIKNHLQGVMGLLRQHIPSEPQCRSTIEEAITQISSVAIVHGLQGRDADSAISLPDMLTAIAVSFKGLVQSEFDTALINTLTFVPRIAHNEAVSIALVLNELIMNAAKHGSGIAQITLDGEADRIVLRITNPVQDPNPDIRSGTGLELVRMLLPRQGATLSLVCGEKGFMAEVVLIPPVIFDVEKLH